jgi:catecholate siderophore receptor
LKVVAGLRFENFVTEVDDRRTVGFPAGQQRRFKVTDNLTSPRLGLIYKPVPSTSIYASTSRTYQPRGGDQLTSLSLTNQNLAPEEFRNQEVGLKWDIRKTLTLTAALYQLDRSNVLALSDPRNPSSATIPIGRQRTEGLELGLAGAISQDLSIVAAYTYSDARFLDSVSGSVTAGNRPANLPEQSASIWARRQISDSLATAVGWSHQGQRFASTDNRVILPAYDRLDAAAFYKVSPDLTVQVNLENLTGARYFLFANNNTNITPGAPLSARVTLIGKF